jgi:hypothetical protein
VNSPLGQRGSITTDQHNKLTNHHSLILDLDQPGAVQVFSSFLDRFNSRTISWIRSIHFSSKSFFANLSITSAGIMANPQGEWMVTCPCSTTPRQVKFEMGEWSYSTLEKRQVFCRSFHEGLVRELTRLARHNNGFDAAAYKSIANGLGKICFNLCVIILPPSKRPVSYLSSRINNADELTLNLPDRKCQPPSNSHQNVRSAPGTCNKARSPPASRTPTAPATSWRRSTADLLLQRYRTPILIMNPLSLSRMIN